MGRRRVFYRYEIPKSVVLIVKSVCADYDRRRLLSEMGDIDEGVKARYDYLNRAIDDALEDIDPGIRRVLLEDIRINRGYDYSPASPFITKNCYYMRKKKVIHDIAKGLSLI